MGYDCLNYNNLIRPIQNQMIRTVWRVVRDPEDAKDTLQNVFSVLLRKKDTLSGHPNPNAFILKVCLNEAYETLRRNVRRKRNEEKKEHIGFVLSQEPSASDRLIGEEQEEEIMKAVAKLSTNQATALLLRVLHDESYEYIAQSLGCSESTARIHVSRAREKLGKMLSHLNSSQSVRS